MRKPSIKKAYEELNSEAAEVFIVENGLDVVEMDDVDEYLYSMEMAKGVDEETLMKASNEFFHRIGVLDEDRDLALDEETEYCTVHHNEYSGKYFVLFNHPYVIEAAASGAECGDTVREFGEATRRRLAEQEDEAIGGRADDDDGDDEEWMRELAEGIKSGAIRSKSGEGYFVLKGEFYDAIAAGRKTTEYRDLTPRNLAMSIGIRTVKLQRGYGHPGQPPAQMRFEVASVGLLDPDDRECDPYAIPEGFIATTIAIHLGRRIG